MSSRLNGAIWKPDCLKIGSVLSQEDHLVINKYIDYLYNLSNIVTDDHTRQYILRHLQECQNAYDKIR